MAQDTEADAALAAEFGTRRGRRAVIAWCLFDWANSAIPTVLITFVFATYFTKAVAPSPVEGTALWGTALSISALVIAVLSPVLGAIADQGGRRKPWILGNLVLCVIPAALLWFVEPEPGFTLMALLLIGLANTTFEIGHVFYNAMMPEITPRAYLGRISGWAWGMGYAGGLCCLTLALLLFVQPDPPLFGLERESKEEIRIIGPMVALWFALFALPLFLWTPDRAPSGRPLGETVREGWHTLMKTLRGLRHYRNIATYLLARMVYTDGLNTLFAFGGIYAAGTFAMSESEILVFAIILNVAAGLGAAGFAWMDDRVGAKPTILVALVGLTGFGAALLIIESKLWFYILGCGLGALIGPAQSASRSLMARLAPAEIRTEMFGLYALSGKATAFVGPALLGWVTLWFDSQRVGMATILVFFVVGLLLLLPVKAPRS